MSWIPVESLWNHGFGGEGAGHHELVRECLGDEPIEITEAAFVVGYEAPNTFYRAFRHMGAHRQYQTPANLYDVLFINEAC